MRQTLLLSSTKSAHFTHPFQLEEGKDYYLALTSFQANNIFPNITDKNNILPFNKGGKWEYIIIPVGYYTIEDLEKYIQEKKGEDFISIVPNRTTLKIELESKFDLRFDIGNSIGKFLGFVKQTHITAKNKYESDSYVDVSPVKFIRIFCNLIDGYYINGKESHLIYSFALSVPHGYQITERPHNLMYAKITGRSKIDRIHIDIMDQDDNVIEFGHEPYEVKFELRGF